MLFLLASANRDDRRFPDGDSFDIRRSEGRHLTFGNGIHLCMGAALARMEGRIALDEVLSRFPRMGHRSREAHLSPTSTVRGWETLPALLRLVVRAMVVSTDAEPAALRQSGAPPTRGRDPGAHPRSGVPVAPKSSIRDWRSLTIRGVADQAGVNERTVYRYFGNERGLRDAVMHRLEQKAGIDLEGMRLDDIADIAARIFDHVSSYPLEAEAASGPDADGRQPPPTPGSLRGARRLDRRVVPADRRSAAALLDVLWSVATYERLVSDWEMGHNEAVRTATWAIGLVRDAIRSGQRPT